jgi:SPOR domain
VRNVFLTLLLVNLAYFAWSYWIDKPPPPPVNESIARLPRLKLASEEPPPPPRGHAPEKTALTVSPSPVPPSQACLSVGPFGDVDNAARAAALLRAKGFDPRQRAEAGAGSLEYAVSVGGMKSEPEAQRMLQNLKSKGFGDALLATDGGDAGRRVSLGLFGERARADERVRAARLKGFKAEVAERRLPGTLYWLDLVPPPGVTTVPITDLFAEGVGSRIAVQPCPPVSPHGAVPGLEVVTPVQDRVIAGSPPPQIAATRTVP